jgi:hypothetical protein
LEKTEFFHIFLFWRVSRLFFAKNCGKLCGNCVKLVIFAIFIFLRLVENFSFSRRETLFQIFLLSVSAKKTRPRSHLQFAPFYDILN